MTDHPIFTGAASALITPLNAQGLDFESLGRLIDWQIEKGIKALVIAGTTGEGSTLSDEEHKAVLKYSVERTAGRVPVIAGTGSNDTEYAIALTKYACEVGCDAMLVVTPYYNKATQKGLVKMFCAIADASTKPIIVYNIPGRTGVNVEPATFLELAKHPRITAVKEASGNFSKIAEILRLVGDKMDVYSGNDDQIVPLLALGGSGVISVLSNVMPTETVEMCEAFFRGETAKAAKMQIEYLDLINDLFCEVNPIPVKAAMAHLGFGENYVRMPLTVMEPEHEAKLVAEMKRLVVIE